MRLLFALLLLTLSACGTMQTKRLIPPAGISQSKATMDDAECTSYHYSGKHKNFDESYYYACMQELGYQLVIE